MRKILVKYGFGNFRFLIGDTVVSMARISPFLFSGMLLIAILWLVTGWGLGLAIPWGAAILYFGFPVTFGGLLKKGLGYFQRFPVQWDELDIEQKWDFGKLSQEIGSIVTLTEDQMVEWRIINRRMSKKYYSK